MKIAILLALTLGMGARVRPAVAFQELFNGIDAGALQAQEMMRQYQLEQERKKRQEGGIARSIGDLLWSDRVPKQDPVCVAKAVARHLGVAEPADDKVPSVWYTSRSVVDDFYSWYVAEYGYRVQLPREMQTIYLAQSNLIYMEDEKTSYNGARTVDDAVAGQLALFILYKEYGDKPDSDKSQGTLRTVERWFNSEYTAKKVSSCAAS